VSHGLEGALASEVVHLRAGTVALALVGLLRLRREFLARVPAFLAVALSVLLAIGALALQLSRTAEFLSFLTHLGFLLRFAVRLQILSELRLTVRLYITLLLVFAFLRHCLRFLKISVKLVSNVSQVFK